MLLKNILKKMNQLIKKFVILKSVFRNVFYRLKISSKNLNQKQFSMVFILTMNFYSIFFFIKIMNFLTYFIEQKRLKL